MPPSSIPPSLPSFLLQIRAVTDKVQQLLHDAFEGAKSYKPKTSDWLSSYWSGFMSPSQLSRIRNTGVPVDLLKVGKELFLGVSLGFVCVCFSGGVEGCAYMELQGALRPAH